MTQEQMQLFQMFEMFMKMMGQAPMQPAAPSPATPFTPAAPPNPFDGRSGGQPTYDPNARRVDPVTGEIYKQLPGGTGWTSTGEFSVPGSPPPMPTFGEPVGAFDFTPSGLDRRSAHAVVTENDAYNAQKWKDYKTAYGYWAKGGKRTQEPPDPAPYYRMVDYAKVLDLIASRETVPIPPEINYNQASYPPPPAS